MVDLEDITELQKLKIEKGLCDYRYIMNNWKKNDADFQKVYYDFYLKAGWHYTYNEHFKETYFGLFSNNSLEMNLRNVLDCLKKDNNNYYFSFSSKLIHTKNPRLPIYDSKVKDYLIDKNVNLWWHVSNKKSGAPRKTSEIEKIMHDWDEICKWYEIFLSSPLGEEWVKWFDESFPTYKDDISMVKKIDFIIYATN